MIGRLSRPREEADIVKPKGFDDFDLRLGDMMRGERATLGKSLLDVQRELKIKATYIAAIENADPTAFDTPGFIAGYVRSYARYLGMDPEWAYQTFCDESNFETVHGMSAKASGAVAPRAGQITASGPTTDPFANPSTPYIPSGEALFSHVEPAAIGAVMVLLLLIGGIGYGGWTILQEIQRVKFAPVETAPNVTATIDPLAPSAAVVSAPEEVADNKMPSAEAFDRLYRPQALDVPVLVPRDGPIAALNPKETGALIATARKELPAVGSGDWHRSLAFAGPPSKVGQPDPVSPKVVADNKADVMLIAVRPAWVQVKSADGTVILEKIMDAGEKYVLPKTEEPPMLRTGYAGAVYFSVNGKTYGPAGQGASVVKNIALGPQELTQTYKIADMTAHPELAKVVAELEQQ